MLEKYLNFWETTGSVLHHLYLWIIVTLAGTALGFVVFVLGGVLFSLFQNLRGPALDQYMQAWMKWGVLIGAIIIQFFVTIPVILKMIDDHREGRA